MCAADCVCRTKCTGLRKSGQSLDENKSCKHEIKKANIFLHDGHTAGPDGVSTEAKKADVNTPKFSKHAAQTRWRSVRREQVHRRGLSYKPLRPPGDRNLHCSICHPAAHTGAIDEASLSQVY